MVENIDKCKHCISINKKMKCDSVDTTYSDPNLNFPCKYFLDSHLMYIKIQGFKTTAIWNKKQNYFHDFGINDKSAILYGQKVEDIIDVLCTISEDQIINEKEQEYWGWYDNRTCDLGIIFPNYLLFSVCFTYGYKIEEEKGKGKAYKLNVTKI